MFENRSKEIDYNRLESLCYLGCYERRLPVSVARMMENAYDWAHLPHVHESSFKQIDLVEEGGWGWRAVTTLPDSRLQHLELLVDRSKNYWATTVLSGDAKGFEIHTLAKQVSANEIDVVIKFYLPKSFEKVLTGLNIAKRFLPFTAYKKVAKKLGVHRVNKTDNPQTSILKVLHYQYSVLYDEDQTLMIGRQEAINRLKRSAELGFVESLSIGSVEAVVKQLPKLVQFGRHRFVVNQWNNQWVVYAADCPHLLGPLENSDIDPQGRVTCPWHGYQFDIISGEHCSQKIAGLKKPPTLSVVDNHLILSNKQH